MKVRVFSNVLTHMTLRNACGYFLNTWMLELLQVCLRKEEEILMREFAPTFSEEHLKVYNFFIREVSFTEISKVIIS